MNLEIGDILSDGSVIASLSRSQGQTFAKMESGARLVAPDYYLLGVTRTKSPDKATEGPESPLEAPELLA